MLCNLITGVVPAAVTPGRVEERLSQGCVRGAKPAARREQCTLPGPLHPKLCPACGQACAAACGACASLRGAMHTGEGGVSARAAQARRRRRSRARSTARAPSRWCPWAGASAWPSLTRYRRAAYPTLTPMTALRPAARGASRACSRTGVLRAAAPPRACQRGSQGRRAGRRAALVCAIGEDLAQGTRPLAKLSQNCQ